jgi:hypothetical protein
VPVSQSDITNVSAKSSTPSNPKPAPLFT